MNQCLIVGTPQLKNNHLGAALNRTIFYLREIMKKTFIILFLVVFASAANAAKSPFSTLPEPEFPLHKAVKKSNPTTLISLIDTQKYDVNEFDEEGFSPLHYAALLGNLACAHVLVDNGKADIDLVVEHGPYVGNTAKRLAQRAKKTDVVSFLKEKKRQESLDGCDCFDWIAWILS